MPGTVHHSVGGITSSEVSGMFVLLPSVRVPAIRLPVETTVETWGVDGDRGV